MHRKSKAEEVERNYDYFSTIEQDLIKDHEGRYALLRRQKVIELYETVVDAHISATKKFSDGVFSIQKIGRKPVELGFFAYAVDNRPS